MASYLFVIGLLALSSAAFAVGRRRAMAIGAEQRLHSRPAHHGLYVALWCVVPAIVLLTLGLLFERTLIGVLLAATTDQAIIDQFGGRTLFVEKVCWIMESGLTDQTTETPLRMAALHYAELKQISQAGLFVVALTAALGGLAWGRRVLSPTFRARNRVEGFFQFVLIAGSTISVLTTIGIVLSMLFEAIRFFQLIPFHEFLFGLQWSPQTAIRADQVDQTGAFGAIPVFAGTLLITFLAMLIAVPIGIFSAVYTAEYAPAKVRATVKPVLEILAGVPTVVYGFFAALTVAPMVRDGGGMLGLDVASESALAAGLVMGIMIIPFISSLSDDVINAVPQSLRDGFLCDRGDAIGNDPESRPAGRPSRNRGRLPAGRLTRHRRDDDRRHGGGPCGELDCESLRGGDDGHRPDHDAAGWRSGIRQREDAGRLRLGHRALHDHAFPECDCYPRRRQISGKI